MIRRAGAIAGLLFAVIVILFIANRDIRRDDVAGDPFIAVDFPATVEPGGEADAIFTISNPGPQDIDSLIIAFARVGPSPGSYELPNPIVDPGQDEMNPNIVAIDPDPIATSPDAVLFRFEGLAEGEEMTITFTFRIPDVAGEVANSVTAYAADDPSRAQGIRVSAQVAP